MKKFFLVCTAAFAVGLSASAQKVTKPLQDYQDGVTAQSMHDVDVLNVLVNVTQGETVKINNIVFEAVTNAAVITAATNIPVLCTNNGSTTINSNQFIAALNVTLNTNTLSTGVSSSIQTSPFTNQLIITSIKAGVFSYVVSETLAGTGNAWASNSTYGGRGLRDSAQRFRVAKRIALAVDVTAGVMSFGFNFTPTHFIVQITDSTGVPKAYNGVVKIVGPNIQIDNTGSTDFANGDLVTVFAAD